MTCCKKKKRIKKARYVYIRKNAWRRMVGGRQQCKSVRGSRKTVESGDKASAIKQGRVYHPLCSLAHNIRHKGAASRFTIASRPNACRNARGFCARAKQPPLAALAGVSLRRCCHGGLNYSSRGRCIRCRYDIWRAGVTLT